MLVIEHEDAHYQLLGSIVEEINDGISIVEYRVKSLNEMSVSEYLEFKELFVLQKYFTHSIE